MKKNMVKETKSELKKVIWPTKKTVVNGTVVVAVMVVLVGAIILAFDLVSSELIKLVMGGNDVSIADFIEATEHDHDHAEENDEAENIETPAENSEPTIENSEVTE